MILEDYELILKCRRGLIIRSISFEELFTMWCSVNDTRDSFIHVGKFKGGRIPAWQGTAQRLVGECGSHKNGVRSLETLRLDDDGSRRPSNQ